MKIEILKYLITDVVAINQQPQLLAKKYPNTRDGRYCEFVPPADVPDEPGVFMWFVAGENVSVGKTVTSLRQQVAQFARIKPQDTELKCGNPTYCRVNDALNAAFADEQQVTLVVVPCSNPEDLKELLTSVQHPRLNLR